ncbi:MAG: glycosyltransferase family 2 protein [Gemmatimonadota bacterium]
MDDPIEVEKRSEIEELTMLTVSEVAFASRLAPGSLLVCGHFDIADDGPFRGTLKAGSELVDVDAQVMLLDHDFGFPGQAPPSGIMVVTFPELDLEAEDSTLEVEDREGQFILGPVDLGPRLIDLRTALRAGLASLDAGTRARVQRFVSTARAEQNLDMGGMEFHRSMHMLREGLRERLPLATVSREAPRSLSVEAVVAVNHQAFYVQGWVRDHEAPITRLTAVSPEGERVDLQNRLFAYGRRDVEKFYGLSAWGLTRPGFISFFELEGSSRLQDGWIFEIENAEGAEAEVQAPLAIQDLVDGRTRILKGLPLDALPSDELMERHVHPAIERLQARAAELVEIAEIIEYGRIPTNPEAAVIVPLYRRIDFLEHQLAQFVHDPELREVELVYVLDSPELALQLKQSSVQLHRLYGIPFRVVVLERNSGFAAANNCGAMVSTAPLLLFLNSDILPDRPGWLKAMVDFYRSRTGVGALGPKLLYEDDSLQHAGMYFLRPDDTALAGLWANMHYFKGLHRNLPAANVTRPVPALTGACLMVARDLYNTIGGFQNIYVQGDHEDSDLCLRLIEMGLENWYLPDVEMYHLEAQSYPSEMRGRAALYNRWIHTRLWGERILRVMQGKSRPS